MRRILVFAVFLFFVSSCSSLFPKTVWYKPDTSLEKSYKDSCECMYDANKAYGDAHVLYYQCMRLRGYKELERLSGHIIRTYEQSMEYLPEGTQIRQADNMGLIYVTGY